MTVRSMRLRHDTGEEEYLVLKRGLRDWEATETISILHSTFTHTPTETELPHQSARPSSAKRGGVDDAGDADAEAVWVSDALSGCQYSKNEEGKSE